MAPLATIAVTAVVNIVAVVATTAGAGHRYFLVHWPLVAGVAVVCTFLVRPVQLEAGLVVIKIPGFPVACVVTSLAFRAETTIVDFSIFLVVARPAIRFCIFERRRCVTLFALYQHMTPQQREGRHLAMVKRGLVPVLIAMAGLALLALLAFVLVVFLVTGQASHLQLVLVNITLVAIGALGLLVLAQ